MRIPSILAAAAAAALCLLPGEALAAPEGDDSPWKEVAEELRRAMKEMEARHAAEMAELRGKVEAAGAAPSSALQAEIDGLLDRVDEIDAKIAVTGGPVSGFRLVDISVNSLLIAGTSTERSDVVRELHAGGHDPIQRGFTLQNVELIFKGAVDPYFNAFVDLVATIDEEGETIVELEEAYATTTSLPGGLQAKAGQFFTRFGRHNPEHPHRWQFVDMPVMHSRAFGPDGLRGPGAELSWLAPSETPVLVTLAAQNANGETQVSFIANDELDPIFGERVEREVRSLDDFVYTCRGEVSPDLCDELSVLLGLSCAYGPNSSGDTADTRILGVDVTGKWRPDDAEAGFPFVEVRGEFLDRRLGFDSFVDDRGVFYPSGSLRDSGGYLQVVVGPVRNWTVAARHGWADGHMPHLSTLDERTRWSLAVTHYLSEFSKIRLQINRDHAQFLRGNATSIWLQFEFNLGSHGAHEF